MVVAVIRHVLVALFYGSLYWRVRRRARHRAQHNTSTPRPHTWLIALPARPTPSLSQVAPTAIQSRLSLLFFAIMFVMLGNQQAIPSVFEDRLLYYREKGAHVYGPYR